METAGDSWFLEVLPEAEGWQDAAAWESCLSLALGCCISSGLLRRQVCWQGCHVHCCDTVGRTRKWHLWLPCVCEGKLDLLSALRVSQSKGPQQTWAALASEAVFL